MSLPKLNFVSDKDKNLNHALFDGAIILFTKKESLVDIIPSAQRWIDLDASFGEHVQLILPDDRIPTQRIIIAPTGTLHQDVDDVRRYKDAAFAAGQRAIKAGIRSPIIYFADTPHQNSSFWTFNTQDDYEEYLTVTVLGFLEAIYEPVDAHAHYAKIKSPLPTFDTLNVVSPVQLQDSDVFATNILAIEHGRRVAKDIGSPDPEMMSPENIANYIQEQFKDDKHIKIKVLDDIDLIKKEYPLAHAVTRASLAVQRHHPRFVFFEYQSPDQSKVKENLYFVGKGVTYDTGGIDIKCSGHMRGMSRDKCGAAAVAGFFKTIAYLKPEHVNLTAGLALVRNSVGPDSYVSDEVIYSRNGTRVLVGNTDAEGRMVMTDLLCDFKERIIANKDKKTPSFIFTVATLTGHAIRAYGGYGIAMDNGFSRQHKISQRIYDAGHVLADPFEISTLRREDVDCVQPGRSSEDVVQANDKASTMTNRGHQYPAGFMLIASGLDKHGLHDTLPIGYTHVDVAGSAEVTSPVGWSIPRVTGSPVAAFTKAFLL